MPEGNFFMNFHLNAQNNKPYYLQLYEEIRKSIVNGDIPYGAKMPSKRTLAIDCGLSIVTVQHTYDILCEEGYLEGRQRSGYYVIYKDSDFLSVQDDSLSKELMLSQNRAELEALLATGEENERKKLCFPFTVLAKSMRKVLLDYGSRILVKSPNQGCHELRSAIASYLRRSNGMNVRTEQIVIGSGAEYLYSLITQLFGKKRIYALENPSYHKIRQVYEANGVVCDLLSLGQDGILSSELNRTEATVLHITPFNSYPSGITASASKRHEYIAWAKHRNAYIIEDNYSAELTVSKKNDDTVYAMSKDAFVIYLNTFSETIAPSVRVGYMILPEALLEEFETKIGFYSCTVPVFEQYVLAELISSGAFERHINRVRRSRRKNKSK